MTDDEREAQAGEYVLGTLPADEREAFTRALATDTALQALVDAWQERLAGLAELVAEATPDPQTWSAIERALDRMTQRTLAQDGAAPAYLDTAAMTQSLRPLRRSRARWRAAAVLTGALAACLALFIATGQRLPFGATDGLTYLAVVNRGGDLPALVVEVDTGAGVVHVRSVAAETPPDRVLELWFIAAGSAPRSLGLLDRPKQEAAIPQGPLNGATLAVSVEPKGGSPTGGPTGPVIYSGKLIPED